MCFCVYHVLDLRLSLRPLSHLPSSSWFAVPESYQRYLSNALRDEFDLGGVPIRLFIRSAANPFTKRGAGVRDRQLQLRERRERTTSIVGQPVVEVNTAAEGPLSAAAQAKKLGESFMRSASSEMKRSAMIAARSTPFAPSASRMVKAVRAGGGKFRTLSRKQKRDLDSHEK